MAAIEHSPLFGGNGGSEFDDYRAAPGQIVRMLAVTIRSGVYIDAIQATYQLADGQVWVGPVHGGGGGNTSEANFSGQDLTALLPRSGQLVDALTLVTRAGSQTKIYGPYGGTGGGSHSIVGEIVALYGRAGEYLDAIGVYGYSLSFSMATVSADEFAIEAAAFKNVKAAVAVT